MNHVRMISRGSVRLWSWHLTEDNNGIHSLVNDVFDIVEHADFVSVFVWLDVKRYL